MLCGLLTIRGLLYCRRCGGTSFNGLCRSLIFCTTRSKSCGFCRCHCCRRSKVSYAEHKLKAAKLDVGTMVEKCCTFPSCSTTAYQAWAARATTALPWILKKTYKGSYNLNHKNTGLFTSHSGISKIDCATTKTDTTERSISMDRESLQVLSNLTAARSRELLTSGGSWQTLLAHAQQSQPMGPDGHFVSQRTGSHSAGISCTIHELFCL